MNGFKDDVISILKDNTMFHADASGWIVQQHTLPKTSELIRELQDRKFAVIGRHNKEVFRFDYVVISKEHLTPNWLLAAFAKLSENGIIIIELEDNSLAFANQYVSRFGGFTGTKVKYNGNYYLVIHSGVDYGN